ncbi:type VI secretion system contractile sheath large subunit [Limibaculum sp. FT325]|uniref:type VI secretion system contractile sheath domain-containing protein n=1 Tax=Thermohalobaculum sediminis TaxID=2939436 RepID=UPI0020C0256E|nr:type VI secretion system contractile sheath large subunit [Limibaculum sediminis]MCL5777307.1 type VI secretion system contractile sheath large subunit [Limibaculum sediminis]
MGLGFGFDLPTRCLAPSDDGGFSSGTLNAPAPEGGAEARKKFRIAILGDFSGRASRGELEIGAELGGRKPIRFDIDNSDAVIERFRTTLTLPIGADGGAVEVELGGIDDLHPDELYGNVEIFSELANLRRRLKSGSGIDRVIADMKSWGEEFGNVLPMPRRRAKGSAVPADRKLSDFKRLIGDARGAAVEATDADELIQRIVAPHVVAAPDPRAESMIAAVDAALSDAMRRVLHHPDFQAVESTWRSLDLMARRIETGGGLEIVLYDVSAEEWAADLSAQDELSECGLFEMLAEAPRLDAREGPLSAIFALYTLEETPPHAELLARMARIAAHIGAPFVASIAAGSLDTKPEDRHHLVKEAWSELRDMPEARYIGVAVPRFLLRLPYGKKTDPVDPFDFEEFTLRDGLKGMLWANPVVLAAILLAETARQGGAKMSLGQVMSIGDMPFHYMTDAHGDQVALPCTERLLTTRTAAEVVERGFMPVLSMKGRNEVRLGSFQSLGRSELAGPWGDGGWTGEGMRGRVRMETSIGLSAKGAPRPAAAAAAAGAGAAAAAADGDEDLDDLLSGMGDDDAGGGDDDLDALLADVGGGDSGGDDDLDALLAGFGDDAPADDGGDDEMDPELAALLEGL